MSADKTSNKGPICGWCGEQLTPKNGKMVHIDGTTAGQCGASSIRRGNESKS